MIWFNPVFYIEATLKKLFSLFFLDKNDIFLPGETEEINEFCSSSKNVSDIQICASVPIVKIVLE